VKQTVLIGVKENKDFGKNKQDDLDFIASKCESLEEESWEDMVIYLL
jgi:hypothetical protein